MRRITTSSSWPLYTAPSSFPSHLAIRDPPPEIQGLTFSYKSLHRKRQTEFLLQILAVFLLSCSCYPFTRPCYRARKVDAQSSYLRDSSNLLMVAGGSYSGQLPEKKDYQSSSRSENLVEFMFSPVFIHHHFSPLFRHFHEKISWSS